MALKTSFFGSSWYHGEDAKDTKYQGFSCWAWVDKNGRPTNTTYNLSDYTGDHKADSAHFAKLPQGLQERILEHLALAVRDAKEERAYYLKRANPALGEHATAFLVTIGQHGHTVYMDDSKSSSSRLSGYGLSDEEFNTFAKAGVPIVDSRSIPDEILVASSFRSPMPPCKAFDADADAAPWGSLSHATVAGYCYFRQRCGATITNCPDLSGITDEMFGESQRETMNAMAVA